MKLFQFSNGFEKMVKGEKQLFVYYLYGCKVWMTNIFFVLDMCLEVV